MAKREVTVPLLMDCEAAIEPTPRPNKVGDERSVLGASREAHRETHIGSAKRAFTTLFNAVTSHPLVNNTVSKGSRSETWAMLENTVFTRRGSGVQGWPTKCKTVRTESGQDPHVYTSIDWTTMLTFWGEVKHTSVRKVEPQKRSPPVACLRHRSKRRLSHRRLPLCCGQGPSGAAATSVTQRRGGGGWRWSFCRRSES